MTGSVFPVHHLSNDKSSCIVTVEYFKSNTNEISMHFDLFALFAI